MPSDTFKYVLAGQAGFPGICVICGSNQRDFIDFGVSVEYHGAILICNQCILELQNVEQLPFVLRSDLEEANRANEEKQEVIEQYSNLRKGLESGLVRVASDFAAGFDAISGDSPDLPEVSTRKSAAKRRADAASGQPAGF